MRIVAGTLRGRRLVAPEGLRTRPILDRQKEALFNVLRAAFPCAGVLDLFAGSGALGIEALSRGAARVTFVERGRPALAALRRNIDALGLGGRVHVVARDVFAFDPARLAHGVGVVFCDPPFPLYREEPERVHRLLLDVAAASPVEGSAVLVLRVPKDAAQPPWPPPLEPTDRRTWGESEVILLRHPGPVDPGAGGGRRRPIAEEEKPDGG